MLQKNIIGESKISIVRAGMALDASKLGKWFIFGLHGENCKAVQIGGVVLSSHCALPKRNGASLRPSVLQTQEPVSGLGPITSGPASPKHSS